MTPLATSHESLRDRALAIAATAACLGRRIDPLLDDDHLDGLITTVTRLDQARFAEPTTALDRWRTSERPDTATLTGRWVRWFDLGRIPPYEGSNINVSAGGVTPRLAEIAGYYHAFGMQVCHDRPDHIVAELEFLAFTMLLESDARVANDDGRSEIAAAAARSFLRDHIGTWVHPWAERVMAQPDLEPWHAVASLAADLVAYEAQLRNVVPIVAGAPAHDADTDDEELACGFAS